MNTLLSASAFLARHPSLWPLSRAWSQGLASLVAGSRGIRPQATAEALGRSWQRSFASPRQVPLTGGDDRTAYAEIHTPCPLRGSGDVQACHRMMAYDRAIAARAGGQFVVLRSQAEPGIMHCRVAMRLQGEAIDDLLPAHLRSVP